MATNKHIIDVQTKGAKKSEKQIKGVGGALGGMAKQAGIAAAAYFGSRMLLDGIKSSVDLFAKQEAAEKKLRFAAGASTQELIRQAQALQQTTKHGDEAIIAQQAYVKSLGISTEQTKEIIQASVDLSAALGISLESAVMNTTKTLSGMQGELGEKLPAAFKELTAEQLKAGEGITFIREQFKGFAEEEADTTQGALAQMSNAIGDAGEALGETLAPIIIVTANAITSLAEGFQKLFSWQDKYKALAVETIGIVSDQEAKLALLNDELKTNATVDKVLEAMLLELNSALDQTAFAMSGSADSSSEWTKEMIEASIKTGDFNKMIEEQEFWGTELGETLRALMILYGEMPEGLTVSTDAQVLFNEQQLKSLDTQKTLIEQQEKFASVYPDYAKQLGFLTKEEKKRNKELEKRREILSKVGEAVKGSGELEKRVSQVNAIINTAEAITEFMSKGQWGRALLAGAVGANQVKTIEAQKFATGGDFITDGPQMIMVGDNPSGQERVQVTPLGGDPNINGPQGGNITLNISGNVLSEEFTEDVIIPQIKEGLRLGGDIGIN